MKSWIKRRAENALAKLGVLPRRRPLAGRPASREQSLERADRARDAGRFAEAAALYRAVVEAGQADPAIGIQLGNMLKECGELLQAEAAYRTALAAAPSSADGWLQLGHALKLLGRQAAAADAYRQSAAHDPLRGEAVTELIALGAGWRVAELGAAGRSVLHDTLAAVHDLRRSLAILEARLPSIESLAALPVGRFDLFRARYRPCPPAGAARATLGLLVVTAGATPGDAAATLAGLRGPIAAAGNTLRHVSVLAPERVLREVAERHLRPVFPTLELCGTAWSPPEAGADWILVAAGGVTLCETAVAWFAHAAALAGPEVTALLADEILREAPEAMPQPILLPGHDPRAFAAAGHVPSLLAVRRELLRMGDGMAPGQLLAAAAGSGRILHIPRLLAERRRAASVPAPQARRATPALPIRIIVATRESGALLERCFEAARGLAERPDALRWTVIDNRPQDGADPVLRRIAAEPGASLLRRPDSFNWSAFNNAAAAAAGEPLLLFLNDDAEMQTPGWDLAFAEAFTDPAVAAAGIRLLYPDGRVQHAGVVLGMNGRAEHEGRGADRGAAGPLRRWLTRRRAAAVTGAVLACRAADFQRAGGFDAAGLPVWFNDIDLCLKLRAAGREILFLGDVEAVHHESRTLRTTFDDALRDAAWADALATMRARWGVAFAEDPTFNPQFSRVGQPFEMLTEPSEAQVMGWLRGQGGTGHAWP